MWLNLRVWTFITVHTCLALALTMLSYTLAFLLQADIRPQTDGCNGLRYNLTADIIESIFRTYPAGEVLHLTLVIFEQTGQEARNGPEIFLNVQYSAETE